MTAPGGPQVATSEFLEVRGVSKSFGATRALRDASLTVRAGEVHVLLGENGAGKSTLGKIVAGLIRPDSGEIRIGGEIADIHDVQSARRLGIAIVMQELSLAPSLTVADNLFLGRERHAHPFSLLRRPSERTRATEILAALGVDIPLDARTADLPIAQKQVLEIAKALLQSPRLLIMDEPTSTLTAREKQTHLDMVKSLRDRGAAILYVTHHLREVFEIGTRVSLMRDGVVRVTRDVTANLTEADLLGWLTEKSAAPEPRRRAAVTSAAPSRLSIANLSVGGDCRDVSLEIKPGEIVGIYGVVGCGRESLGRAIVGILPVKTGGMTIDGRGFKPASPSHAARLGVGYLPMDRKERGILPNRSIRENLNLASLSASAAYGLLSGRREIAGTGPKLASLGVRYGSMEDPITSLSGGNQQKVLFGRAIARRPRLVVLEDPTAGIDMGAKLDMHRVIRVMADEGASFLLLSSDLSETLTFSDRVYTMYAGRIQDEIAAPEPLDEERVLAAVLGYRDASSSPFPPVAA
jgi:ribose transport system ATP-binding protein